MSLPFHLSLWPLLSLICSPAIPHKPHTEMYPPHILCTSRHLNTCPDTHISTHSVHPRPHMHIHTLTFRLISPCRASRYSYISVQSEKGSCRQFSLNLRISILSWKPLFTGGCAADPPPQPTPTRIKLNIAKAKQQCITTLCDIFGIHEIEQTK